MATRRQPTELPYLIGLGYQKQVGKDTFANLLADTLVAQGHDAIVYSIATPLKNLVTQVFGVPYESVFGGDAEKNAPSGVNGLSVRRLLQDLGCAMREAWPGIWSDALTRSSFGRPDGALPEFVIVPDVRFRDEFDICNKHGITVKITRNSAPKDSHHTESNSPIAGAEWSVEVENNGTLDALAAEAGWLASCLEHAPAVRPTAF